MARRGFWILLVGIGALALLGAGKCERPEPCTGDWQCAAGQECTALCLSSCPPGVDCCMPEQCIAAACLEDGDCALGSTCQVAVAGPVAGGPGTCVEVACGSDESCPEGSYCAGEYYPCGIPGCQNTGGVCLPSQCDFDVDCPAGHRCQGSSVCPPDVVCVWEGAPGICVGSECTEHADCSFGCNDGFCSPPPVP